MVRHALLLASLAVPSLLGAQSWRTLGTSRQLHDTSALQVRVQYGSGKISLAAAPPALLYEMRVRYDATRTAPIHSFAAASRTLQLGVQKQGMRIPGDENELAELRLGLGPAVPLDLSIELGATEADLDLSTLRLARLKIESHASDASVRFDAPNPLAMKTLELDVGAAGLTALRLANANAGDIRVSAGLGNVDLDLGGEWTKDINLEIDATLGVVTVHVPSDVGVRVELQRTLAGFGHRGLTSRDGAFYSDNWESASRKLRIRTDVKLGRFELDQR
jgi:hypothetical protein